MCQASLTESKTLSQKTKQKEAGHGGSCYNLSSQDSTAGGWLGIQNQLDPQSEALSQVKQNKAKHLSCCPTNVGLPGGLLQAAFSGFTIHHSPKPSCYFLGSPCSANFFIEVKHEASCLKAVGSVSLSTFIMSYCHLCSSSSFSPQSLVPKKHSLPISPKVNTCQTLIFVSQESRTLDISCK